MPRFSVDDDEDGSEERPSNNNNDTPLSKKPRTSNPLQYSRRSAAASPAAAASTSSFISRELEFWTQEQATVDEESERETVDESDTFWSDSSSEEEEEVQPIEAQVNSTANGNGVFEELEEVAGPVSITLTDSDVLDCPVCFDPLSSPVFQCENGHVACSPCCTTMRNKCPSCCLPIGYNRCRGIEKVLEAVRISCRNKPHGCMETVRYCDKLAHEKTCISTPCSCPYLGCDFVGSSKSLYTHFGLQHPYSSKKFVFGSCFSISLDSTEKYVYLQERSESVVFVFNRSIESFGSFVNVVCVGPTSGKSEFLYEITASAEESLVKLETCADCTPKWNLQTPVKKILLVPSDFISFGQMKLGLTIWRKRAVTC